MGQREAEVYGDRGWCIGAATMCVRRQLGFEARAIGMAEVGDETLFFQSSFLRGAKVEFTKHPFCYSGKMNYVPLHSEIRDSRSRGVRCRSARSRSGVVERRAAE